MIGPQHSSGDVDASHAESGGSARAGAEATVKRALFLGGAEGGSQGDSGAPRLSRTRAGAASALPGATTTLAPVLAVSRRRVGRKGPPSAPQGWDDGVMEVSVHALDPEMASDLAGVFPDKGPTQGPGSGLTAVVTMQCSRVDLAADQSSGSLTGGTNAVASSVWQATAALAGRGFALVHFNRTASTAHWSSNARNADGVAW